MPTPRDKPAEKLLSRKEQQKFRRVVLSKRRKGWYTRLEDWREIRHVVAVQFGIVEQLYGKHQRQYTGWVQALDKMRRTIADMAARNRYQNRELIRLKARLALMHKLIKEAEAALKRGALFLDEEAFDRIVAKAAKGQWKGNRDRKEGNILKMKKAAEKAVEKARTLDNPLFLGSIVHFMPDNTSHLAVECPDPKTCVGAPGRDTDGGLPRESPA